MTISEIIDFYYRTNTPDFDVYEKHDGHISAFSHILHDIYYNHLIPTGDTDTKKLLSGDLEFKKRNRPPVVCVTPLSDDYNKDLPELDLVATDTWMQFFGTVPNLELPKDFDVKLIGKEYLNDYIDLFMGGFSGGVYGTLAPEYADVEKRCFMENETTPGKHLFAMAFFKGKPVGVVRALMENDKSFIFGFAIPKKWRFRGMTATVLGTYILQQIVAHGAKNIFLQTEADTVLERFYSQNGFKRLFLGKYYTNK